MAYPTTELYDEVTIYARTGRTAYGKVLGSATTEAAYLEPGFKLVTDARGQEVTSSLFGVFASTCTIAVDDEIEWESRRYRAVDVQRLRFKGEAHHVEVYFSSVGAS